MSAAIATAKKNKSEAILNGRPLSTLLIFALPIILGNIFQQLYNIVDAIVVGRYLGDVPLAGISVASPLMDILYALILGGCVGVGVLIGRFSGAGNWEELKKVHATALVGGSAVTLCLTVLGLLFTERILLQQGSEPEIVREAMRYLRIILGGLIFSFLYNYYAAALRSWGDSRTPFIVLLVSSILHALLDIFLCGALHLGIQGVACSTVFCQIFSTVCLMIHTELHCPPLRLTRKELRVHRKHGSMILSYAWAAALQQAVVMIGRFLVQGTLIALGSTTVTGYNMGMRVEAFLFCFSQGISAATVVALAQNIGAGNLARVRLFFRDAICVLLVLVAVLGTAVKLRAPQLVGIFSDNPEVIRAGVQYLGTMAFFYPCAYLFELFQGFYRGTGRLRLTMAASMTQVAMRVPLSAVLAPKFGVYGICAAVAVGWVTLTILEGGYSAYLCRTQYGPEKNETGKMKKTK